MCFLVESDCLLSVWCLLIELVRRRAIKFQQIYSKVPSNDYLVLAFFLILMTLLDRTLSPCEPHAQAQALQEYTERRCWRVAALCV